MCLGSISLLQPWDSTQPYSWAALMDQSDVGICAKV